MIEVAITYDLLPDIDRKAYLDLLKKAIVPILTQPGIIEIRARRSLSGSPDVMVVLVWQTMANWNMFEMKKEWAELKEEITDRCTVNMMIQIWGPSPIAPEPLRPSGKT